MFTEISRISSRGKGTVYNTGGGGDSFEWPKQAVKNSLIHQHRLKRVPSSSSSSSLSATRRYHHHYQNQKDKKLKEEGVSLLSTLSIGSWLNGPKEASGCCSAQTTCMIIEDRQGATASCRRPPSRPTLCNALLHDYVKISNAQRKNLLLQHSNTKFSRLVNSFFFFFVYRLLKLFYRQFFTFFFVLP